MNPLMKGIVMEKVQRSLTPHFPTYRKACHFLRSLDGVAQTAFMQMRSEILSQRGDPQHSVDWTDPDEWIFIRLSGADQELAEKIWVSSNKELNPRHLRGVWYLSQTHNLLEVDSLGVLRITERGQSFINNLHGKIVIEIDQYEGVLVILQLVAELGPGKRSAFLTDYGEFCRQYTTYRSEGVFKSSMYDRLRNLVERGLIERNYQTYEITEAGLNYLDQCSHLLPEERTRTQAMDIERLAKQHRDKARQQLLDHLLNMDPFKFEELIEFLLIEMGYTDVDTTSPISDRGKDVMAIIELGISSLKEVIQVKRHRTNLHRTVLDQLRGSLHRFDAVRGTIITTSGFSSGAIAAAHERGAAPITLIDGERLLDLLIENGIGIKQHEVKYFEFDPASLSQFEVETDVDGEM